MAIVSNFELLVKRIGPPGGVPFGPPGVNAPLRRLLQGYYLTVSNPNDRLVSLRLQATFPTLDPDSPFTVDERELVSGATPNHFYAYDRTGDNSTPANPRELLDSLDLWDDKAEARTFQTTTFRVDCDQTGLLNIVPNPANAIQPDPQIEIRGYTRLVQVVGIRIVRGTGGIFRIEFVVPDPVDLLVTPEIRGTFLDDQYASLISDLDFDQSNYALPTATGRALINVSETVNPFFFPVVGLPPVISSGGGFGRFVNPASLIKSKKLTGRLNLAGQFSLDDKSIKYIQGLLGKTKGVKYNLKEVVTAVQKTINDLGEVVKGD